MKSSVLLFVVCLLGFNSLLAQNPKDSDKESFSGPIHTASDELNDYRPTVIPDYFLLGTLSDYIGRFYLVDRENQIDCYYKSEKPIVDYLAAYIEEEYKLKTDSATEDSRHYKTYSKELSKILNQYYNNNGRLKEDIFHNHEQIGSFLLGAYYRYGEKIDSSIYKTFSTNSPKHYQYYILLKRIGCENILYKHLDFIPAHDLLYFEPSKKLAKYLQILEVERALLVDQYYEKYLSKDSANEDGKTSVKKLMDDEKSMVKNAFKPIFP